MSDIQQLQRQIAVARTYLWKYFNADATEDHLLAPPTFCVEFPDVDRAVVCPRKYGQIVQVGLVNYRLAFLPNGDMEWRGRFAMTDKEVAPIRVNKYLVCEVLELEVTK